MKKWDSKVIKRRADFMSHISDEIRARAEHPEPVTLQEYQALRMNSYERKFLLPHIDNETLIYIARYSYSQIGRRLTKHQIAEDYSEALMLEYAPLLCDRLEEMID